MSWWEWVFSGIGASIVILFIQRWLKSSPEHKSSLTAQGAKVSSSPVASGTGITQTISETHHQHYAQSQPAALPQVQPAAPLPAAPQRPLPNIILTSSYVARVSQVEYGVWSERVPVQDAFILQLTNQARSSGRPNVGALIKAQLVYYQGVRELRRITGCWLEQGADMTEFRVNDTHGLLVGLMGGQFTTVGKRRIRVALGADEVPQDIVALPHFDQGTVLVQLTHADTGEVLYEGRFQLNTRPPEIIRL